MSPTIPTMVRHGPYGSEGRPCLTCFPIGSSFGQYFLARLLLTIATGNELGVSLPSKYRPLTRGILSVSKYVALTGTMPAFGSSPESPTVAVAPAMLNACHQLEPRIGS